MQRGYMSENNTYQWTDLRYRYYLAGRTLLFNNQIQSGVLMLGYAVEAHFKHILSFALNISKKHSFGHNFFDTYKLLQDNGYFQDVDVSDDLILFVEDNFDRRYPSQTNRTINRANARGHAVCMAPDVIINYDEFIIQLDQSLIKKINDPEASILAMGAQQVDCGGSEYFFHNNYSALERINLAIQLCEKCLESLKQRETEPVYNLNVKSHNERLALLRNTDLLLKSDRVNMFITPAGGVEGALQAAKNFIYPGRHVEHPDGSFSSTSMF